MLIVETPGGGKGFLLVPREYYHRTKLYNTSKCFTPVLNYANPLKVFPLTTLPKILPPRLGKVLGQGLGKYLSQ